MSYDLIGDIHGYSETLERLLTELGYKRDAGGVYCRPDRNVVFLGDFIDRGPYQREVISIVRTMIDAGAAKSVMGNHEYNAIAYATPDENGGFLRQHNPKNDGQHAMFLDAYTDDPSAYRDVIDWFKTLPLWLDLGDLRVIHACWDKETIQRLGTPVLTDNLLHASCDKNRWEYGAIETILKGKEIPLPDGHLFHDKDGNARHNIRIRWWDRSANTYALAFLGPESARTHIPDEEIEGDHLIEYSHEEPPVFLGHYWMEGDSAPLAPNIACMDYSVAKSGGKLVAYRWDGERELSSDKFVSVERQELQTVSGRL
ncbi:MAG: metallophosphoesterase [Chloroflexi bacterium]|nr:metallophosphoesterase [Chloroflexota bacterium]